MAQHIFRLVFVTTCFTVVCKAGSLAVNSTVDVNGTTSGRTYYNSFQSQGFSSFGSAIPSTVNYFANAARCSDRQAPLNVLCPQQPQCTVQAQKLVCDEYVSNNLTETARLNSAPATYANVTWSSGAAALSGNVLTTAQVKSIPSNIVYPTKPNALYTILLQDVGESAAPASQRDIGTPVHYLVVNVPGTNLAAGDMFIEYFPPIGAPPPFLNSPTLYNLFVYEQRFRLALDEPRIPSCSFTGRSFFRADKFAEKYSLIGPQFGNFFRVAPFATIDTVREIRANCDTFFSEQFRQAGLPYAIKGGFTMNWQNNNIAGFGNVLRPAALGSEQPQVFSLYFDPNAKYTVVLLDQDFPGTRPYINWLVVNAGFRTLVSRGTAIIEYQRPAPPADYKTHRFVGLLYQQPSGTTIDPAKFSPTITRCDTSSRRSEFNLDDFVKNNNLTLLDGSYTRMRYDGTTAC